ncbi:MAG: hypothetical protein JNM41_11260 [Flavipsychrobacter sp.]|nr:hypothetical protein [Flavipsychrobacter sp.]
MKNYIIEKWKIFDGKCILPYLWWTMKLKFINSNELDKNIKASIHKTGKIGFTTDAARKLALATNNSVSIAVNLEDSTDLNLYVIVNKDEPNGSFKISKAGDYYYINAKALFDNLEWDYLNKYYSFDIKETNVDGMDVWVFKTTVKDKEEK